MQDKPNVKEVILSGGDPLSVGYENLSYVLENLKEWNVRIHTRSVVYDPSIIDNKIIELLSKYNVRLVFHINHPYEICETVEEKIKKYTKIILKCMLNFLY